MDGSFFFSSRQSFFSSRHIQQDTFSGYDSSFSHAYSSSMKSTGALFTIDCDKTCAGAQLLTSSFSLFCVSGNGTLWTLFAVQFLHRRLFLSLSPHCFELNFALDNSLWHPLHMRPIVIERLHCKCWWVRGVLWVWRERSV